MGNQSIPLGGAGRAFQPIILSWFKKSNMLACIHSFISLFFLNTKRKGEESFKGFVFFASIGVVHHTLKWCRVYIHLMRRCMYTLKLAGVYIHLIPPMYLGCVHTLHCAHACIFWNWEQLTPVSTSVVLLPGISSVWFKPFVGWWENNNTCKPFWNRDCLYRSILIYISMSV